MNPNQVARAAGAALLLGWQLPATAAMITYTYAGVVTETACLSIQCTNNPVFGPPNRAFGATLVVDSADRSIASFSFSVGDDATWQGFGGRIDSSDTSLAMRLAGSGLPGTITSGPPGILFIVDMLALAGPASAFGGFIDGLATTFDLPSMTTRSSSNYYSGLGTSGFRIRLDAVAGRVGADEPTASLPEPGTTAMVGLAGLAALRARRRQKAGAA